MQVKTTMNYLLKYRAGRNTFVSFLLPCLVIVKSVRSLQKVIWKVKSVWILYEYLNILCYRHKYGTGMLVLCLCFPGLR